METAVTRGQPGGCLRAERHVVLVASYDGGVAAAGENNEGPGSLDRVALAPERCELLSRRAVEDMGPGRCSRYGRLVGLGLGCVPTRSSMVEGWGCADRFTWNSVLRYCNAAYGRLRTYSLGCITSSGLCNTFSSLFHCCSVTVRHVGSGHVTITASGISALFTHRKAKPTARLLMLTYPANGDWNDFLQTPLALLENGIT